VQFRQTDEWTFLQMEAEDIVELPSGSPGLRRVKGF
jgi:hypothetical protein